MLFDEGRRDGLKGYPPKLDGCAEYGRGYEAGEGDAERIRHQWWSMCRAALAAKEPQR